MEKNLKSFPYFLLRQYFNASKMKGILLGAFKRIWYYYILSSDVECIWNHTFQRHVSLLCPVSEAGFTFNLPFLSRNSSAYASFMAESCGSTTLENYLIFVRCYYFFFLLVGY